MGKTRDLFKKIRDTKGTFHEKMGSIKDRNGMDDQDNHNGVITHLEADILECEVKWALGSIARTKLVEVMEFQLSYFKSKKMMLVKVLHSTWQQIWKTQQWPQDWKRSVFIPVPKKGNAKLHSSHMLASNAQNSPR